MNMIKKFKSFPRKKKRRIYSLIILGVIGISLIAAIFRPDALQKVSVETIKSGWVESKIETVGTVSTDNSSEYTLIEGTFVKEVNVKVGSVVKKGDLIATFDPDSAFAIVSERRADYTKAKNAYDDYMSSVKNAKQAIPAAQKQVKELEREIKELEKQIAEDAAKNDTQTTTSKTTEPPQDGSILDELSELLKNLIDIKGTLKDLNDMLSSFNNMNNTSYDMSSLMAEGMNTPKNQLISLQIQLVSLNAQLTVNKTLADAPLESIYKSLCDKAYADKIAAEAEHELLKSGWYADFEGVVTTVNISPNTVYVPAQNKSSGINVSAILSVLSGGGDVGSLLSSFLNSSNKSTAIEIKNYDGFTIDISLDKYDLQKVKVGQKVKITSVSEKEYDGEVCFVAAEATESTSFDIASLAGPLTGGSGSSNAAICKIKINNPDTAVVIGFDVDLEIITSVVENVPIVPVEAVRYDDKGMFVWILSGSKNTVSKSYVTFGVSEDTKYELVSGAKLGDTIIINPPVSLADGDKVAIKKD
ncbi:MAG TPA: biotin/lipoyl-binding protein [Oscillospiraceae bacterium]|nr:biotin/lipoyl-binding protein [Oscillospiraceae bacterium]